MKKLMILFLVLIFFLRFISCYDTDGDGIDDEFDQCPGDSEDKCFEAGGELYEEYIAGESLGENGKTTSLEEGVSFFSSLIFKIIVIAIILIVIGIILFIIYHKIKMKNQASGTSQIVKENPA